MSWNGSDMARTSEAWTAAEPRRKRHGSMPDRPPPAPAPPPAALAYGTADEWQLWKRLLFMKFLVAVGRLGKGDLEAER